MKKQEYMTIKEFYKKIGYHNKNWRGGKTKGGGYILININGTYIPEHRLIWLQHSELLEIPKGKVIHHINGIKDDNKIENLQIMTSSEHSKLHQKQRGKNV